MSWYTLKDLIDDCVNKKSRTDLPRAAKRKVLTYDHGILESARSKHYHACSVRDVWLRAP